MQRMRRRIARGRHGGGGIAADAARPTADCTRPARRGGITADAADAAEGRTRPARGRGWGSQQMRPGWRWVVRGRPDAGGTTRSAGAWRRARCSHRGRGRIKDGGSHLKSFRALPGKLKTPKSRSPWGWTHLGPNSSILDIIQFSPRTKSSSSTYPPSTMLFRPQTERCEAVLQ